MFFQRHRHSDAPSEPPEAQNAIACHTHHADYPEHRKYRKPDLQRIRAGKWLRCKGTLQNRIDHLIQYQNPGMHIRSRVQHDIRTDRFTAWDQTENTLNGKRNEQAQARQSPQAYPDPLRCIFQKQTKKHVLSWMRRTIRNCEKWRWKNCAKVPVRWKCWMKNFVFFCFRRIRGMNAVLL